MGDPSIHLNFALLPDYVIEEPQISVSPSFISIAESAFTINAKILNIGRSVSDSVTIQVKRQYPDGSLATIHTERISTIRYSYDLVLSVPVVGSRDKGLNKITVTVDSENEVAESSESNNTSSKEIYIYEDEARPVYPYNFSIINEASPKLYASTADPLSPVKSYVMEMDTTALFNSPLKVSGSISSIGGILEFTPGVSLLDSTVYYWRVALVPTPGNQYHWNVSSFIYIPGSIGGSNQSHFHQHTESSVIRATLDSASRQWHFGTRSNELIARTGVFPTAANQADHISITINGITDISSVCGVSNVIFNVFSPVTLAPWFNANPGDPAKYGSDPVCGNSRKWNFQYNILDTNKRRKIVEFLDLIPDGHYIVMRNTSGTNPASNTYASDWKGDTSYLGSNNSMYHRLLQQGFVNIDSFNTPRGFIFIYKKNRASEFSPRSAFSEGIYDRVQINCDALTPDTIGYVNSPLFGPAKQWHQLKWEGLSLEAPSTDAVNLEVVGVDTNMIESPLFTIDPSVSTYDISMYNAQQFPYMKLKMTTIDTVNATSYQLKYWRLLYEPVPEGAVAPNLFFTSTDTLEVGEKFNFGLAFKNISPYAFDSLSVRFYILDRDNRQHHISLPRTKPLISGDSVRIIYEVDTKDFPGLNILFLEFNPGFDQPEQYHFNNFIFKNVYVRPDLKNPLLDVTFDGIHILNRDIVSSKPNIVIKLKDEAKFMLLNDTSLTSVQVRYPDQNNTLKTFNFNTDTVRFIPAASASDNTATVEFRPYFPQILDANGQPLNPNGDEYELIVKGKDRSGNKAGNLEYRVTFKVIDKPMISNLLNYPNPFTTSTAFVFTLTGSEIPTNMKIQILTVTGKIVREITRDELGPIHIGRNITEFKWDGTDQYGQKLANGVYLYRVVTSLNGKNLEKYKATGDNTDKFFNNGYGKMYLMR
jgi:flagellar hook assembly protein FlgD